MSVSIKEALQKDINKNTNVNIKVTKKNKGLLTPMLLILPALFFLALFTFLPLFKVILDSTQNKNPNFNTTYGAVWRDGRWYLSIFNSFVYAIISVPLALVVALIISFNISNVIRKNFREFWQTIFFLPYVTSSVAISIVFSTLFSSQDYGIINWLLGFNFAWLDTSYSTSPIAFIPVIIFGVWHSISFKILILTSAMLSIDKRLYDSAAIDSASKTDMFFNITLPSLESTIWYLVTIGLITSLKVYPMALFGNSALDTLDKFPTMMTYVYYYVDAAEYAKAGAASVSLIVVVILFNYIINGSMKIAQTMIIEGRDKKMEAEVKHFETLAKSRQKYDPSSATKKIDKINKSLEESKKALGGDE